METQYTIDVICTPGRPLATWTLNGKRHNDTIKVEPGDTLVFKFQDSAGTPLNDMTECMLMSGAMDAEDGDSPFTVVTPYRLADNDGQVTVAKLKKGLWGFSIAIVDKQPFNHNGRKSAFYFLPDPELQVGSNGGD